MPTDSDNVRLSQETGSERRTIKPTRMTLLRENVRARKARRIVFSIVLSRQLSQALLFFKSIEVETKFPFANSISAFSRSQTRTGPQQVVGLNANLIALPSRSYV
jgi:hypothetical protein